MTEFTKTHINPSRSAPLRFKGLLLAETHWDARDGYMRFELWETEGGALIAVTEGEVVGSNRTDIRATVVEPIPKSADASLGDILSDALHMRDPDVDHLAMRWAVMDHFDWHDRARSMVKKLGWKLLREVA